MTIVRGRVFLGNTFAIPKHWTPIPWTTDDWEISRRCGEINPRVHLRCGRRDGHVGVCVGGASDGEGGMVYWMWW